MQINPQRPMFVWGANLGQQEPEMTGLYLLMALWEGFKILEPRDSFWFTRNIRVCRGYLFPQQGSQPVDIHCQHPAWSGTSIHVTCGRQKHLQINWSNHEASSKPGRQTCLWLTYLGMYTFMQIRVFSSFLNL